MLAAGIDGCWEREILPILAERIAIPAQPPQFDADWIANGPLDAATALLADWARINAPVRANPPLVAGRCPT